MRNIRVVSLVVFVVLFATSSAFADRVAVSSGTVIQTQNGTRTLASIEGLTTENSLRQGGRIAEIATGEVTAGVSALLQADKVLGKEIADFETKKANTQASLEGRYADFKGRQAVHNAEAGQQHAAAAQKCPDQACMNRINSWRDRIDARKKLLDAEVAALFAESDSFVAKSKADADNLNARVSALKAKMGLAYSQLKMLVEYSRQINEKLRAYPSGPWQPEGKHPGYNPSGKYPVLDKAMEQIKELSNRGFDTK
ncbi:MAG: hypothetical protein HZB11_02040 [Candidatus Yonathbacteria bacterium]|nr:hypothetical protein [Candidatus Yonathbacteria bacterium]